MDPGNSTMRKICLQSSMTALKEVVRVFPMVALNDTSTRLAVGDAIGEINNASIRVYDMQSMNKIKVLDASGPPGLPSLLGGTLETANTTAISALSFSPDGADGVKVWNVVGIWFLMTWWSLGSVWWEKLSRNFVPVQCTKLIFVPPWEGFSPNSTRSSIMASVLRDDGRGNSPLEMGVGCKRNIKALGTTDCPNMGVMLWVEEPMHGVNAIALKYGLLAIVFETSSGFRRWLAE
ncbi:UNVERIFIED_CONTAM: hypothetical protein Sangu_3162200 [Sesamum angustifolium]|uniref:Uncharacterized protein n=1 Tax=Sesamum angustifolium TaxID=2727405 RepID=A0AAW2JWN9_9LAMI